jgi:hypothetical protein
LPPIGTTYMESGIPEQRRSGIPLACGFYALTVAAVVMLIPPIRMLAMNAAASIINQSDMLNPALDDGLQTRSLVSADVIVTTAIP